LSLTPWPVELRATDGGRRLKVLFDTGEAFDLPASELRRQSPSAEGRGHGASAPERPAAAHAEASIAELSPIGRYAVRIVFDDGHDTGLFTWDLLARIGRDLAAPG